MTERLVTVPSADRRCGQPTRKYHGAIAAIALTAIAVRAADPAETATIARTATNTTPYSKSQRGPVSHALPPVAAAGTVGAAGTAAPAGTVGAAGTVAGVGTVGTASRPGSTASGTSSGTAPILRQSRPPVLGPSDRVARRARAQG